MKSNISVFSGRDLVVRYRPVDGSANAVVTFTHRSSGDRNRKGYGEDFFVKTGISAVHFVSSANHWWQTGEMLGAIHAVNNLGLSSRYENLVTYGASMGGHGALLFSGMLNANRALAFSPQFAVGGRNAAWKETWNIDGIKELYRFEDLYSTKTDILVLLDLHETFDVRHLRAFREVRKVRTVNVPLSRHDIGGAMVQMGLLSSFVRDFVAGNENLSSLAKSIKTRKRTSLFYLSALTARLKNKKKIHGAAYAFASESARDRILELINKGVAFDAKRSVPYVLPQYFEELNAAGENKESIRIARRVIELDPSAVECWNLLAHQLELGNEYMESLLIRKKLHQREQNIQSALGVAGASFKFGDIEEGTIYLNYATASDVQLATHWIRFLNNWGDSVPKDHLEQIFRQIEKLSPNYSKLSRLRKRFQ